MSIQIKEVTSRGMLRTFIHIPQKLHKNEPNWMPTILVDDWNFFDAKKNHSFDSCDTVLAIAYKDGIPVGRIMGIIHRTYNDIRNENNARFGYFDSVDDQEVAHSLIEFITSWAKKFNKSLLVGPYGFSDKDVQGLLIDGFEKLPLIDSACNPAYIVKLIEKEGFVKEVDCMTYKFPADYTFPELYHRVLQRYSSSNLFKLVQFTSKKQLKPYIVPVLELVNRTYDHLYGFVPMTDKEIHELANRYLPIIDPRFVNVIEKDGNVVAFIVAIPNFTRGIQRSGGHLFPFGIFHILRSMKKSTQLDLMLGAIQRDLQGSGLEVIMGLNLIEKAKNAGFKDIMVHLVLENNVKMRAELDRLGIPYEKLFRVFRKEI